MEGGTLMSVLVVILHEKNCSKDRHGFENHGVLLYTTILKSYLEFRSLTMIQHDYHKMAIVL